MATQIFLFQSHRQLWPQASTKCRYTSCYPLELFSLQGNESSILFEVTEALSLLDIEEEGSMLRDLFGVWGQALLFLLGKTSTISPLCILFELWEALSLLDNGEDTWKSSMLRDCFEEIEASLSVLIFLRWALHVAFKEEVILQP